MVGGVLVLVQGIALLVYSEILTYSILWNSPSMLPFGLTVTAIAIFGIIVGICVLGGAYLMSTRFFKIVGGLVVLIVSIVSLVGGGGWLLGSALGICGGLLGLFRK